jgi:hypothetical protein
MISASTGDNMTTKRTKNWIRKDKRLAIYLRDGMACAYCGAGMEMGAMLTLDHLICVSHGGSNGENNLITCCHTCNSTRGAMKLDAWLQKACGNDAARTARFIIEHTAQDLRPFKRQAKEIFSRRITAHAAQLEATQTARSK